MVVLLSLHKGSPTPGDPRFKIRTRITNRVLLKVRMQMKSTVAAARDKTTWILMTTMPVITRASSLSSLLNCALTAFASTSLRRVRTRDGSLTPTQLLFSQDPSSGTPPPEHLRYDTDSPAPPPNQIRTSIFLGISLLLLRSVNGAGSTTSWYLMVSGLHQVHRVRT